MKYIILFLIMLTSITYAQIPFGDSIMPFGAYSGKWACQEYFTTDRLDSMSALGFNQHMCGGFTSEALDSFINHGIYPHPWSTIELPPDTCEILISAYFETHPEQDSSDNYASKFITPTEGYSTYTNDAGYFVYGDSGNMLDGLYFRLDNRWTSQTQQNEFHSFLKISIDTTGLSQDAVVGIFTIMNYTDKYDRFIDTIRVGDLPCDSIFDDIEYELVNDCDSGSCDSIGCNYFTVIDSAHLDSSYLFKFSFETTGLCEVYIDYFKFYDQYGFELLSGALDDNIIEWAGRTAYKDNILSWFLFDTMRAQHYRTFVHVDSLIKEATIDSGWTHPVRGTSWINFGDCHRYREFVRIDNPEVLYTYIYPIDDETEYTGNGENGFQNDLTYWLTRPCDSIRAVIDYCDTSDVCSTQKWLYTPQAWYCDTEDCTSEPRRKPTRSEIRCMTYIGMCYHPMSILYWKLDSGYSDCGNQGIFKSDGSPRDGIYDAIAYDINPYIKAIDEYYMPLEWQRAYCVSPAFYGFTPPAEGLFTSIEVMRSIGLTSENATYPPDDGWFHVGEFKDTTTGEDYFMIVNRSCSMDRDDSTEATPVTALMTFNRSALGNPNSLFITDVAASTRLADGDTGWVAVPETTYTNLYNDSLLYFTTVLKAGEGRLFKIETTDEIILSGNVNTNYNYQGYIHSDTTGTITVPSGDTMTIVAPAEIEIYDEIDWFHVYGTLEVNGYESDSVNIYIDNMDVSASTPFNGLRFYSGSSGDINYCKFYDNSGTSQGNGFSIQYGAQVDINHCELYNWSSYGAAVYTSDVTIKNTSFHDMDLYGVLASASIEEIDSCTFDNCHRYAIVIDNSSSNTSYITNNTISISSPNDPNNSAYGITASSQDNIFIQNNTIRDYSIGGIRVMYTEAELSNNNIIDNGSIGIFGYDFDGEINGCYFDSVSNAIYLSNTSDPLIKRCTINSVYINRGIYATGSSYPNLGIASDTTTGYNTIRQCASYYFYINNTSADTIMAENNYFGGSSPPAGTVYGPVDCIPYILSSPSSKQVDTEPEIPLTYNLDSNYPNPFNPTTNISYSLAEPGYTNIIIYNILGQNVRTLVDEYQEAGEHIITWDGKNSTGKQITSGIYFYRITSGDFVDSKKMLLLR